MTVPAAEDAYDHLKEASNRMDLLLHDPQKSDEFIDETIDHLETTIEELECLRSGSK